MNTAHHLVFGKKYKNLLFTIDSVQQKIIYNGIISPEKNRHGINTAIDFSQGYIVTKNNLPISGIWSFSFWMKTTQTTIAVVNLMGNYLSDGNIMMLFNNAAANKFQVNIKTLGGSGNNVKYANDTVINDGNWKHIVVVLNRNLNSFNEISIYINSIKQSLTTQTVHNTDKTTDFSSLPINFGANPPYLTGYYEGSMSDIKLFTRELTQAEITELYNE